MPSPNDDPPAITPSPCVRLCTLNDADVCVGCGRTLDDIKAWSGMNESEKAECVARARETLVKLGRPVLTRPFVPPRGPLQRHR